MIVCAWVCALSDNRSTIPVRETISLRRNELLGWLTCFFFSRFNASARYFLMRDFSNYGGLPARRIYVFRGKLILNATLVNVISLARVREGQFFFLFVGRVPYCRASSIAAVVMSDKTLLRFLFFFFFFVLRAAGFPRQF